MYVYLFSIGAILVLLCLIIVFWPVNKSHKNNSLSASQLMDIVHKAINNTNKALYWEDFKRRKPQQAVEIQAYVDFDLENASDLDAFETVTMFLRWSYDAGVSIGELKEFYHDKLMDNILDGNPDMMVEVLNQLMREEAVKYHISERNTSVYYIKKWTLEMIEGM